jgi:FtsZ-binding cell division protein ZapB
MFDELLAMGSGAKIGERLSQEELEGVLQWLGFSGSVEGKSKTQLGAIILQKLKAADKKTLDELWATYKKQVVEQAKVLQAEVDELKAIADAATEEQRASDDYNKLLEEIEKKEQAIAKLKG